MNPLDEERLVSIFENMSITLDGLSLSLDVINKTIKRTNDFLSLLVYCQSCKLDDHNKQNVQICLKDMSKTPGV